MLEAGMSIATGFFSNLRNLSSRIMAQGFTQLLIEMSIIRSFWG
jgi:hypothetical protein